MIYELPMVTRVHTATGSHIEPALPDDATNHEALLWHAAVAAVDSGLDIRIAAASSRKKVGGIWFDQGPQWSILVGRGGTAALDFRSAWTYLNGVVRGACAMHRQLDPESISPDAMRWSP